MLLFSILLALVSLYPFYKKQYGLAIGILFLAALLLRYHYIALDPFLHDWDERYHALVAKNMIHNPLKPMLRLNPALEYDFTQWSNNHVWLHKQPLFLWQMALSMSLFGVNEIALRLPNMLMGSLSVLLVYRIGSIFTNKNIGFLAAFITVFARYQLELVSGSMGIDHNDLAFMFYTTASIWAYSEYKNYEYETTEKDTPQTGQWKWLLAIGVFSGAAILCKWLTGILVFSGWGIALLTQKENRRQLKNWLHLFAAFAISCTIFLPWQIYIHFKFPIESAYERAYSSKHFTEAIEGHSGGGLFYVEHSALYYGYIGTVLAAIGLLLLVILRQKMSKFWIECLVFTLLPYLFFSAAATKMPTFVYVISPLLHICIALVIYTIYEYLNQLTQRNATQRNFFYISYY
jgi:4-amino-4-deoxy-L-arabinose transferase-like glycosyltransferase